MSQTGNPNSERLRQLLDTKWPLFTAFRVEVQISWTVAIMPLFFLLSFTRFLPFGSALLWSVIWTLALYTTVYTHEMGHISAGRSRGIDTTRMTLRAMGGLAHLDAPAQRPKDEIFISLAGPATHFAWMAVLYPIVWLLPDTAQYTSWGLMLEGFARFQITMCIFNLLPIYPLDGGRVLRGFLAMRVHANEASLKAAKVGYTGNALLGVVGILSWLGVADPFSFGHFGFMLAWIGYWGWQMCRQLEHQAKHGEIYAEHDPFQKVLFDSAEAGRKADAEEQKLRAERRKLAERRAELQGDVDRLLDRINEVGGVKNLPRSELKALEQASAKLAQLPPG